MAKKMGRNQAVGISSAPPQPRVQMATDRMIRKAGQLHGQDRRDYKAAQEAGRGKSFMRNFQNQAAQQQQQIAKEAGRVGYQPQGRPMPRPMPQQQPGAQQGGALGYQTGQPMRPIAQPGGAGIDPGFNQWPQQLSEGDMNQGQGFGGGFGAGQMQKGPGMPPMPPGFGPGPGGFQQMANPWMNQLGQWANQGAPGLQFQGGSQGFNENASAQQGPGNARSMMNGWQGTPSNMNYNKWG